MTPLFQARPTESDHSLKVSKTGYLDKTLHIRTPKGYKLHVTVYLSINPASTPTLEGHYKPHRLLIYPLLLPHNPKLLRLLCWIHQLDSACKSRRKRRKRGDCQVKPGIVFCMSESNQNWYQVKLTDGKIGWISSQYAKKE